MCRYDLYHRGERDVAHLKSCLQETIFCSFRTEVLTAFLQEYRTMTSEEILLLHESLAKLEKDLFDYYMELIKPHSSTVS